MTPNNTDKHRLIQTVLALAVAALFCVPAAARAENFRLPDKESPEAAWWRDSRTNLDERLSWFRDARFGMFIHWGVSSSLGNEYQGRVGGGYSEHIQRVLKIPIPEYRREVAGIFNPTNFNADAWVSLASQAGMKYIIITAKHHDGFAMWPSKVNDYNIIDATPWKHDPMKDLKAACQKHGIKFGFYYSQAFDWGNTNAAGNDWECQNPGGDRLIGGKDWWNTMPEFMASARRYVDTKAIPQILELIKTYDPDILWFDTPSKLPPSENLRIMKAVREASPRVVISGRLVQGWGDYDDTCDRPANFPPHANDWEAIPTMNESFGWNKFDHSHKTPAHFIQLIAKAAARGGNVLLNVGPMGTGEIDPKDVSVLQEIGDWWQVYGASIRGTTRTPLPVQAWGESTRKGNTLYLHVFHWPADGQLVVGGLKSKILKASLLSAPDTALAVSRLNERDVALTVPAQVPSSVDSVVAVALDGEIQTDAARLLQPEYSADTLRAFDGQLEDKGLRFGPGKKTDDYALNWTKLDESVSWPVRLNTAATYEVWMNYTAAKDSADGTYAVRLGTQTLGGRVKAGTNQLISLGKVTLTSGSFAIQVVPVKIVGGELMQLRSLELRPEK